MTAPAPPDRTVHTQVWFGPEERPLYGWVSTPAGGLVRGGAILCPPMGEEGRSAHRTFRRLAETLADQGIVALRFDYDGTGDSAGLQDDPDRVASWLASVEAARQLPPRPRRPRRVGGRHAARRHPGRVPGRRVLAVPLAGPVGPVPERPHLPARGRGAVRPRRGRRPGARRRSPAHPRLPVRRRDGVRDEDGRPRQDPGRPPARRPGAAAVPHRPAGSREHREAGPARAGPGRGRARDGTGPAARPDAQRLLRPGGGARRRRRLAGGRQRRGPGPGQGARGARRPAVLGGPRVAASSSSARCGSDRSASTASSTSRSLPPTRRGWSWSTWPPSTTSGPAGAGSSGPGAGRATATGSSGSTRPASGTAPSHEGQVEDEMFAPEWIGDMREVVQTLSADGAPVVVVGLCSGSYSAFEVALWEKVEAVFAVNPRVTLFQAAKGTHVHTSLRRAGIVPARPGRGAGQAAAHPGRRDLADLPPGRGLARPVPGPAQRGQARHRGAREHVPGRRPALHRGAVLAAVPGPAPAEPAVPVRAGRDLRPLAAEPGRPAGHLRARLGVPGDVRRRCPPRTRRRRRRDQPARPRPGDVPPARAARRRAHLPGDQLLRRLPDRAGRGRRARAGGDAGGHGRGRLRGRPVDVLQAGPRGPARALRARPARDAALPVPGRAGGDPAGRRPVGDPRGRLVLPARRRGHGLPAAPREELARRRGHRPGRQGAPLLPQRRLLRAVR